MAINPRDPVPPEAEPGPDAPSEGSVPPPLLPGRDGTRPGRDRILPTFEQVGAGAWRLVGVGLVISFGLILFLRLRLVMLPLIVALFIATLLEPLAARLKRWGWPPALATFTVFVGVAAAFTGIILALVPQTVGQFDRLGQDLERAIREVETWLIDGPLNLSPEQVQGYVDQVVEWISGDTGALTSRVVGGVQLAGEILAGIALTLVLVFFYVKDGDRIAAWALTHVQPARRDVARAAARRAWGTLSGYLRGTSITGLIDAVFIGIGLALLDVPLVLPLALLTFFGAFFPVIGAPLAGLLAVAVAFVSHGPGRAIAVAVLVFAVQQIESYLLAPNIMGRAVRLHPIVVLVALTTGGLVAGIIGAFLAVPVTAVGVAVVGEIRRWEAAQLAVPDPPGDGRTQPGEPGPAGAAPTAAD